ncbi:2,4-dihydroxyhept-2-ene-1,7-dioic acid aldolase [Burkholderia stabilis]|uniref:2,4-dihydroxyhept-2-ene-1,7-dioic acid aldolase n=1 Tax=Burkholderia stabilis TaxID=95485 RepID=A0A4Q2AEC2_9BURK|nr:aldolase/citrate lyase family protein [Burkholderia stabilis]RXV67695.1 2,4-dihydroxyhept-2-ene-1,7-dioic acid aldolase [Burkholderia stabilis]
MRENRIRQIWRQGGSVINGWLAIPSAFSAEAMAHQGWDALTVDLQHGVIDYQTAVAMFAAISTTDTVPMARVPWNDPGILMKVLDAGAYGVICPMVNTADEARRLVAATRYPPLGQRSLGPIRAQFYAGADYPTRANDTVVVLAQIETAEALGNLDAILAVDGLDGVYIGPADLSLSLGCRPTFDDVDPPVVEAIARIRTAAHAAGKAVCIHNGSADFAAQRIRQGFDLVTISSDVRLIAAGAQAIVRDVRQRDRPPTGHDTAQTY